MDGGFLFEAGGEMPEELRRMVAVQVDPARMEMVSQLAHNAEAEFFDGLTVEQALHMGAILDAIVSSHDAARMAAVYKGRFDMLLSMKFNRCTCCPGWVHTPDTPESLADGNNK